MLYPSETKGAHRGSAERVCQILVVHQPRRMEIDITIHYWSL